MLIILLPTTQPPPNTPVTQKHLCTFDQTIPLAYNYLFSTSSLLKSYTLQVSTYTLLYESFANSPPIKLNYSITCTVQYVNAATVRRFCHSECG